MSRKDLASLLIIVAAIAVAITVPLIADDPASPAAGIGAGPAAETFTTPGDAHDVAPAAEPPPVTVPAPAARGARRADGERASRTAAPCPRAAGARDEISGRAGRQPFPPGRYPREPGRARARASRRHGAGTAARAGAAGYGRRAAATTASTGRRRAASQRACAPAPAAAAASLRRAVRRFGLSGQVSRPNS
jgi:hypothetical protein